MNKNVKYLIVLCLVVILVIGGFKNIFAQTLPPIVPTPTQQTRDGLISEIKIYAERHAKTNTSMQTQMVIELFSINNFGLSPQEIATIYEKEYIRVLNAQKETPWDKIKPEIGWIVSIILLIVVAFGDAVKKILTDIFNRAWDSLYRNLAGKRIFRKIALTRYQKSLVNKYQKLKIPFRPERPLDMREIYVPLQALGISEDQQLDAFQALVNFRKLMIFGQPGSGKSMLLKHLALTYADNRLNEFPDYPIPILIDLHRLNDPKLTLNQLLIDEFDRNDFPKADHFIFQNLKSGTLLILLDGLDEVLSTERKRVVQEISDFISKYSDCRFVVTCRTAVYKHEFDLLVDKTFEIAELTDQQIRRFLKSWDPELTNRNKSTEQLMLTLRDRPKIMQIARNPLMLTIITYLYTDIEFILPNSRAEFYRKSTDILLDLWHQEHNKYRASDKRQVLQHLAFFNQDQSFGRDDRKTIDSKDVIEQVNKLLPQLNLQAGQDGRPLIDEIVERSGLLLAIDGGEKYQFAHLTLQEYFSAAELKDDSDDLLQRFLADSDSWGEVVKLWCGLDIDSTKVIKQIFDNDPITALECLADAQKVDQSLADSIISKYQNQFGDESKGDLIVRAFAAIASDTRARGMCVIKFLEKKIFGKDDKTRRAAATALSLTNLPQAANILATQYSDSNYIRTSMVRMGDLAIPALAKLADNGNKNAVYDLQQIGTPQSVDKLVHLLWSNDAETSILSAWCMATVLHKSTIEEQLRTFMLTNEEKNEKRIDWIWSPFNESEESSLPFIAGRIAYLISETHENSFIPDGLCDFDPRIVIPILYIIKPHYFTMTETNIRIRLRQELEEKDNNSQINLILPKMSEFREDLLMKDLMLGFHSREQAFHSFVINPETPQEVLMGIFNYLISDEQPSIYLKLFQGLSNPIKRKIFAIIFGGRVMWPRPNKNDWINIFNPIKYNFDRSVHRKIVWLTEAFLSFATFFLLIINVLNESNIWSTSGLLTIFCIMLIAINWLLIWDPFLWMIGSNCLPFDDDYQYYFLLGPLSPVQVCIDIYWPSFDWDDFWNILKSILHVAWILLVGYVISINLLDHVSWYLVVLFWVAVYGICVFLWKRGKTLDRLARNPLRDLLEERVEDNNQSRKRRPRFLIFHKKSFAKNK